MSSDSFSDTQQKMVDAVLPIARTLSKYAGIVEIIAGDPDDSQAKDTDALTTWSPFHIWHIPKVRLFPGVFDRGQDALGVCITHELIHCRQGFWRVYGQKLWWGICHGEEEVPVEVEADEAVNLWFDHLMPHHNPLRTG